MLFPIALAYVTTHTARAVVPANHLGVPYEDVAFATCDGLELEGWYVPSRNGAAVIAFPGRSGPQKQARMLARHGYGVLLFDRRGEGRSDGEPNAWGWGGCRDVEAAIAFLRQRPDVEPGRIARHRPVGRRRDDARGRRARRRPRGRRLRRRRAAHVRRGHGRGHAGLGQAAAAVLSAVKTASVAVFATRPARPPGGPGAAIAPTPLLLIAAPDSGHGEDLNRDYYAAAGAERCGRSPGPATSAA